MYIIYTYIYFTYLHKYICERAHINSNKTFGGIFYTHRHSQCIYLFFILSNKLKFFTSFIKLKYRNDKAYNIYWELVFSIFPNMS